MDEKDKKEKYIKFLFELAELPEAFMGLQVYLLSLSSVFEDVNFGFDPILPEIQFRDFFKVPNVTKMFDFCCCPFFSDGNS